MVLPSKLECDVSMTGSDYSILNSSLCLIKGVLKRVSAGTVTVPKDATLLQTHEDNKYNSSSLKLKNQSIPTDNVTNQDACCSGVPGDMRGGPYKERA